MNANLLSIISDSTNNFINQVKDNLARTNTNATMETSNSLHYEVIESSAKITITVLGKPFMAVVETGRKPTPDKKPSRNMIDNITKWVEARGKPESAAWAIAVSIQKKGTDLFRKGGRTDIYTDAGEEYAEDLFYQITKAIANDQMDLVIKGFVLK